MKVEEIIKRIDSFQGFFDERFLTPQYEKAWELNKHHGLYLNHLPKESAEYIEKIVERNKPQTILEIGTSVGYSTLHLARASATYGGKVYTIEKSAPRAEFARVHFLESGLGNITLFEGKAEDVLNNLKKELFIDKQIDLLFLDGGKKQYLEFLKMIEPHLSSSGIIIADNVSNFSDEVSDFISYIKQNPRYVSEILPMPNGLLVTKKLG